MIKYLKKNEYFINRNFIIYVSKCQHLINSLKRATRSYKKNKIKIINKINIESQITKKKLSFFKLTILTKGKISYLN